MASVGEGEFGVFHSLVIASFAANKSCITTTRKLGGNLWIFGCSMTNSGVGSTHWMCISEIIEKILFQKDRTDLHDQKM